VTVHANAEQARKVLRETFEAALTDAVFGAVLKENEFSLQFVLRDPEVALYLAADGVEDEPHRATLRLESDADALHEILLGQLPVTRAVVDRRLAVKGQVSEVRRLADLLPVIGGEYARRVLPARAA